jgi:hypothetical protein
VVVEAPGVRIEPLQPVGQAPLGVRRLAQRQRLDEAVPDAC